MPESQPASPDGGPGEWHVVGESSSEGSWEWHPAPTPRAAPGAPTSTQSPWSGGIGYPPGGYGLGGGSAPGAPFTGGEEFAGARDPDWNSWRLLGRVLWWWVVVAFLAGLTTLSALGTAIGGDDPKALGSMAVVVGALWFVDALLFLIAVVMFMVFWYRATTRV